MKNMNLMTLMHAFDTDEECRTALIRLRWPDGIECPRCKGKGISIKKMRFQYDCNSCRYQFSVTSGTMFQDSHIPLPKWFAAIYLMIESRKGISANQLKRTLKVGYQTAWFLSHRIRKAMEEANPRKLDGTIEVDETYIGGRYDKRRKRGPWEKQAVMGMIERDGKFEAQTIPTPSARTLVGIIRERVEPSATVFSDDYAAYKSVAKSHKRHDTVNHTAEEWVRGEVHTNNIESAWSLFNRSIVGAFHKLSTKHMNAYLNEFEWRFNNRSNPYLFRDTLLRLLTAPKMEYKDLIEKTA
ncbi:MAG: IS1595 family transposase [Acidobacteria bacterium]|nr:IS1595 family transposase [Acidobacteriota bacterium]